MFACCCFLSSHLLGPWYPMALIEWAERVGTVVGIVGAFLVACKLAAWGYPCFLVSSLCLLGSALGKRQRGFIALQGVYLLSNLLGLFNYA